jgi:hypothetical protein
LQAFGEIAPVVGFVSPGSIDRAAVLTCPVKKIDVKERLVRCTGELNIDPPRVATYRASVVISR